MNRVLIPLEQLVAGKLQLLAPATRKRAILTGTLCLFAVIVCVAYAFYDLSYDITYSWPLQLFCAGGGLAAFFLNRTGHFTAAKVILGLVVNITVFVFSTTEPIDTGLCLFFSTCALGAFTAFGREEVGKALFFAGFSLVLFTLSMVVELDWFPHAPETMEYQRTNLVVNFFASSVASILMVYFLVNVNYRSEQQLQLAEARMSQQNQELVKINSELDRFVYSTSHDLRAPLSSIAGLVRLARMTEDPTQMSMYLSLMEGRVESLNKFIQEIADYSRNARTEVKREVVDVDRLVKEVLEVLRFFPGSDRMQVHTRIPLGLQVETDPTRMRTIVANLLSNAYKYADLNKPEPMVVVTAEVQDGHLVIGIEDNGIGIPEQYQDKIFDMFFRAHDSSEGSGLGLYIVKESVDRLGGSVTFRSRSRQGSTFNVVVPLANALALA